MIVPEHAEVSDAHGGHQRADHLVELARSCSENPAERRVSHVQKRLYGRLGRMVSSDLVLRFVNSQ